MFSEKEIDYLKSQRLARIATVSKELQPDIATVGFDFDGTYFYVGGLNLPRTLKYKNTQSNPKAALVVDDVESVNPWRPRGIKIHGVNHASRICRRRKLYQDQAQRDLELGNRGAGDPSRQAGHEEKQSDRWLRRWP